MMTEIELKELIQKHINNLINIGISKEKSTKIINETVHWSLMLTIILFGMVLILFTILIILGE